MRACSLERSTRLTLTADGLSCSISVPAEMIHDLLSGCASPAALDPHGIIDQFAWRRQMTDSLFPLSEEHRMIRDAARDFAQNAIAPIAAQCDESGEFPHATIKQMGEMGFMGIEVPEQYGGAGMDTLAYVLAMVEISKADASHGTVMSVNNSLYCQAILVHGSEEQKKKYVMPIASGEAIGAYSLTEPMSGSDAGNMKSRAVLSSDGTHYVINGRKSWVTSAPV